MSKQNKPSIVFAHGLWADGSCFSKLIPTLQAEGHEVIASQNSLDSLAGDVAAVKRALARVSSPAILVGHSYGGTLITAAGTDRARGRAGLHRRPRPGRRRDFAEPAGQVPDDRRVRRTSRSRTGASGCSRRHRLLRGRPVRGGAEARLGDPGRAGAWTCSTRKVEGIAWRSKPSWYIVAKNDRTVHPELERFVAKRMGATTFEVDSSHVPMLSNPSLVIDVIRKAANAAQKSQAAA